MEKSFTADELAILEKAANILRRPVSSLTQGAGTANAPTGPELTESMSDVGATAEHFPPAVETAVLSGEPASPERSQTHSNWTLQPGCPDLEPAQLALISTESPNLTLLDYPDNSSQAAQVSLGDELWSSPSLEIRGFGQIEMLSSFNYAPPTISAPGEFFDSITTTGPQPLLWGEVIHPDLCLNSSADLQMFNLQSSQQQSTIHHDYFKHLAVADDPSSNSHDRGALVTQINGWAGPPRSRRTFSVNPHIYEESRVSPTSSLTLQSRTLSNDSRSVGGEVTHSDQYQRTRQLGSKERADLKALVKPRQRGPKGTQRIERAEARVRKTRGPFTCLEQRLQTSQTRQMGSCIRCSLQKIRCTQNPQNPTGDCINCIISNPKFGTNIGCLRYTIGDVALFRLCPSEDFLWTRRWADKKIGEITVGNVHEDREVFITQGYGNSRARVAVYVREYSPHEGDVQDYKWIDGGLEKTLHMPPFALVNLTGTGHDMRRYIDTFGKDYIEDTIDESNQILWQTFGIACNVASIPSGDHHALILDTLRLWVASRLIEKEWRICGEDTLGMTAEVDDKSSPYFDWIPVTPIIDYQLEQVVIHHVLNPLRNKILKKLTELLKKSARKNWFTINICMFILLHNYEIATSHDRYFAIRHSVQGYYSNYPLLRRFHSGAKTLLAHYHYINKGSMPFYLDWNLQENIEAAELDREQVQFMRFVSAEVKKNEAKFKQLKASKQYDKELYLVAQLYDSNWVPGDTL